MGTKDKKTSGTILLLFVFTCASCSTLSPMEGVRLRGNFHRNTLTRNERFESNDYSFISTRAHDPEKGRSLNLTLSAEALPYSRIGRLANGTHGFRFRVCVFSLIEYREHNLGPEGFDELDEVVNIVPLWGSGKFLNLEESSGVNNDLQYYVYESLYSHSAGSLGFHVGLADMRGFVSSWNATLAPNAWHWRVHVTDYPFASQGDNATRLALKMVLENRGRYIRRNNVPYEERDDTQIPLSDALFLFPSEEIALLDSHQDTLDKGYFAWARAATTQTQSVTVLGEVRQEGREIEYDPSEEATAILQDPQYGSVADESRQYAYFSFIADSPSSLTWEFFVGMDEDHGEASEALEQTSSSVHIGPFWTSCMLFLSAMLTRHLLL